VKEQKRQPERTCIGCRGVFKKDEVIRVVAGPTGFVIDYREKLPGRAAYVCPRIDCIRKALGKGNLSRSLNSKAIPPGEQEFVSQLTASGMEKIKSLIVMAAKAGRLLSGYSAVHDGVEKGRVKALLFATDLSDGTREKIMGSETAPKRQAELLTKDEIGALLNRELVGVLGITDKGFADAIFNETDRLKNLISGPK
jgi:predicted RNA-binding protein YlxR (DUF448 family)/ribosomal protein L30E